MKKTVFYLALLIGILFSGCEEVIVLDLTTASPKLVIEAAINWDKGTNGKLQKIKLTTTAGYYNTVIPKVLGANVFIKNSSNAVFTFVEKPNTGEYSCSNFIPVLNETYSLTIISNGETYTAKETLMPVAPITKIVQNNEGGFAGKNIEIKTYYMDPANETNYYLYKYLYSSQAKKDYYVGLDEFYQGNEFFSFSQSDNLKVGDKIVVSHYGISKAYYNYMNVLIEIAGSVGGRPFQSPPTTVRGNIINTTDAANYPLGYFSLSEVDSKNYTVE